ncbi:MAG: ATP-dependent DNA helicase [Candidatus Obscuribacterales bacterium]
MTKSGKKTVVIGIRDFAMPCPLSGSIEVNSGYSQLFGGPLALAAEGRQLHSKIQKDRQKLFPIYKAEVKAAHKFESERYIFNVSGRMDGLVEAVVPVIEEIKSSTSPSELLSKLAADSQHPYCLQLATYAYILYLEKEVVPLTRFLITSNTFDKVEVLDVDFKIENYEKWLTLRLAELESEVMAEEAARLRRMGLSEKLVFPFTNLRRGQRELVDELAKDIESKHQVLVQAPTGLGKTIGVIYPVLQDSLARGQKLIYVTPKNTQHSVAQEAITRLQDGGAPIKVLTLNAKAKMCLKDEVICNPGYCQYARDYYTKMDKHKVVEKMSEMTALTAEEFKQIGEEYEVCPFEASLDAVAAADVIIGDYNYVFSPRNTLGRFTYTLSKVNEKPNLVIDEAHNLPQRAADYYSKTLSSAVIAKHALELSSLPFDQVVEARALVSKIQFVISNVGRMVGFKESKLTVSRELFDEALPALQDLMVRRIARKAADSSDSGSGSTSGSGSDPLMAIINYFNDFMDAVDYEGDEFFHLYTRNKMRDGSVDEALKVVCCDASAKLKLAHKEFEHVVAFSATIKPFDYFAQLSGLDDPELSRREYTSPFPREHRKLLIIPQVSTKYSDRERNFGKIAEGIARIVQVKPGNYFVFFPSFAFLGSVFELIKSNLPNSILLLKQESEITQAKAKEIMDSLGRTDAPTIVFAVQGGVFAEGVDYPGDMIIGAIIVGPGLPNFNFEREQIRTYYEKRYGNGFDYAYVYPAMAKVIQAAGRVIRSGDDRGLIVLMDQRFIQKQYASAMPSDWFEKQVGELVSSSIIADIESFWQQTDEKKCLSEIN